MIDVFTFRLLFLFFPGIICKLLVDSLVGRKKRLSSLDFFVFSYLYGLAAYLMVYFFTGLIQKDRGDWSGIVNLLLDNNAVSPRETLYASVVAVFLGFLMGYIINKGMLYKVAYRLNVSKRYGDGDVWSFVLNNNSEAMKFITLRDLKSDICYDGWVRAFSETSSDAELFLRDVSVFKNSTGERLYQVGGVYLARNRDDISIEFRAIDLSEDIKWEGGAI